MIDPKEFLRRVIARWEGGYQTMVSDSGNWVTMPDGRRVDVGTNRGVTPAALAKHLGVPAYTITPERIKAVTLDEAAEIGLKHYYDEPGFVKLPWGPATAALLDFAWMSGPARAAIELQRTVRVPADGVIGPMTAKAYAEWVARVGWDKATEIVHDIREAFYREIATDNPDYEQFLQGWLNRDDWASAQNPEWVSAWGDVPLPKLA